MPREGEDAKSRAVPALLLVGLFVILAGAWLAANVEQAAGADKRIAYLPALMSGPKTATPTPSPTPTPTATMVPTPTGPGWLQYLNSFRALAGQAPVTEQPDWSYGDWLHSRYMVKEDTISHGEDPGSPWYSVEGDAAAQNGNIAVSSSSSTSDDFAIEFWISAPFHGIAMIDPQLHQVGFGSYREDLGLWNMGATLDVSRGRGELPPGTIFPIPFPKDGGSYGLTAHWGNEWPDPLTSCAGYSAPTGPPIMLQLGDGSQTPQVTDTTFSDVNGPLEHCVFDETSYWNPSSSTQYVGRLILDSRDAVIIMPRLPLVAGRTYNVSVTANGGTTTWSFEVQSAAKTAAPPGDYRSGAP